MQQFFRQGFDLVREGGGEQQVLTLRRQLRQHAADIMDKAHIQHAVRFVQHQHFHLRQVDGVLMRQIEQTARRSDQHIDAATQFHHLRVNADAAENHQRTQVEVFAVVAYVFADLRRQFARRRQDQGAYRTAAFRAARLGAEPLQQRQGKAGGFAGAGLGARQQIASGQHHGNRLTLDRRRFTVALFSDRAQNIGTQAERVKRHVRVLLRSALAVEYGVVFRGNMTPACADV